jgi:hypothetical protein
VLDIPGVCTPLFYCSSPDLTSVIMVEDMLTRFPVVFISVPQFVRIHLSSDCTVEYS